MHDESNKQPCCIPPWEPPQVIPAQVRRVNNLIFRKINQFHRENNVDNVTPMHDWIMSYLYWHKNEPVYQRDIEREFSITRSTVTNILQLALSLDYAIIFCNHFKEEHQTMPLKEAVIESLSKSIPEISSSSLTTIGGLVAMLFMQFKIGPDMGICLIKATIFTASP